MILIENQKMSNGSYLLPKSAIETLEKSVKYV